MKAHQTQCAKLLACLRERPYGLTYVELQRLGISSCPHRRLSSDEVQNHLRKGERVARRIGTGGLVRIYITRTKA